MENKKKQKILFVSVYYEVLKTYIPLIKSLEDDYDIYVLAKHYPFGTDKELSQEVLKKFNGELIESLDLGDQVTWRRGKGLKSRWYRLVDTLLKTVYVEYKANNQAQEIIERINPDLVILGSDSRTLEKYLVRHCEKQNITSVCFQWALTAISRKAIKEGKTRTLSVENRTFLEKIMDKFYNYTLWFVRKFNGFIMLLLRLRVKLRIKPTDNIRVFGQGNASKLALIGNSSKKFQLEMGTSLNKLEVIGHPLYESLYNDIVSKRKKLPNKQDIYKKLDLPEDAKFVLWANNDSKKQYAKYYSDEYMFDSWKEKLLAILNADSDIFIVFKIHPVWNHLPDFKELEKISPRVKVIAGMDIEDILPFSSALVIRHSMAAIFGMLYHVPLISFNYPPLPVGSLFSEIGGTIHVNNSKELEEIMDKLLSKDKDTLTLIEEKKRFFLDEHLSISSNNKNYERNDAILRFKTLVEKLLKRDN